MPVALWHFLALHHCVRHHFRAFGRHWVSGGLKGAIRAPLHVLVVLLCSAYSACSCSSLFKASHPIPPLLLYFFKYSLIIIYSVSFPLFFQFSVMGAGAGLGQAFSDRRGS